MWIVKLQKIKVVQSKQDIGSVDISYNKQYSNRNQKQFLK